jgi:hypothetical protein
MVFNID